MPIRIRIHTGDADQWITAHGTHILIGANGEVKAGAGGKLNGVKVSSTGKKPEGNKPPVPAQRGEKLSANEKSALSSYSGDDFLRINKELRGGNDSDPQVKRIDSAIEKSPLAKTTLYRGMSKEAARNLFPGGHIKSGMTISDPAFSSTSKSSSVAGMIGMGGVILKIETGENATGIDMSKHSRNEHEKEVLLPRNAKMKVVGLTAPKSPGDPVIVRVAYGD